MQNKRQAEVLKIYDFFNYPIKHKKNTYDLLWPCFQYEVRSKSIITNLNIFEFFVLRMFPLKMGNIDKIAEALCLDKNLVYFVISGLKTKNFVDDINITEEGKNEIDKYLYAKSFLNDSNSVEVSDEPQTVRYEEHSFFTFADCLTGQLLPFVRDRSHVKNKRIKKNTGNYITYYSDSDMEHQIFATKVDCKDEPVKRELSQTEVIQLLFNCRRKYSKDKTEQWPDLSSCRLSINQNPTPVLVHFSLEIGKNFGDLIVSNETGDSYFQVLSNTLEQNSMSYPWISDLKKDVLNVSNENLDKSNAFINHDPLLKTIEKAYKDIQDKVALLDIKVTDYSLFNNLQDAEEKIINSIYLIMEMVFKYLVRNIPDSKKNQIFDLKNALLQSIIQKIFSEYKIKHNYSKDYFKKLALFNRDDLISNIALCLTIERNQDNHKPLKKLFSMFPSFLLELLDLKSLRDTFSHRSDQEENSVKLTSQKIKDYINLVQSTIELLIPSFIFPNLCESNLSLDQTERIKASLLLEKELPSLYLTYVKKISTDLFNFYIDINVKYQRLAEKKSVDEYNLILQLTRFLEATFSFALSNEAIIDSSKIESLRKYKRTGIEIIRKLCDEKTKLKKDTGIDMENDQSISETVFEWLKTIRERYIVNACQNENSTLGGLYIAIFLRIKESILRQIIFSLNQNNINISETVHELVTLRKHNESTYKQSDDLNTIYQLKNKVFFIVKSIMENTNE